MINPFDDTYFMKKALQEAEAAFEKGEIPVMNPSNNGCTTAAIHNR